MAIIEATSVTKIYPSRRGTRRITARGGILDWIRGRKTERVEVLKDITFEAEPGDVVGIIGRNGSGKSTLLKILAGVTLPSRGEVVVRGRCASLLELGAGFHPHLTGRENIYLNAGLLGVRHAEVDAVMDQILEFAGIGEAIEDPVETYSSGMYVRLAFSVAVHANPDIFLIDEVLSVGDKEFQRKCRRRISELRGQGKTIIFVSHDLATVGLLCNRIVLLDQGKMVVRETPLETIDFYLRQIGRARGVHTMAHGDLEAIFNHGRLNLFHQGGEVTVAPTLRLVFKFLHGVQQALDAEWHVAEQGEHFCAAVGEMPNLNVRVHWRTELEDGTIVCTLALECTAPMKFECITVQVLLPLAYRRFYLGDLEHEAPEIGPGKLDWQPFSLSMYAARSCLAVAVPEGAAKPFSIEAETHAPYAALTLLNSDFVTGARVIDCTFTAPPSEAPMAAGRHELLTLRLTPALHESVLAEHLRDWEARRVLRSGRMKAVLSGEGYIALYEDERPLTRSLHVHFAYCINHVWSHSRLTMAWSPSERDGDCLRLSGASTRLPFKQHWELRPVDDGIAWRVYIEALEPLDVQEYSAGVALEPGYSSWRTAHESGAFPAFDPEEERWLHLNRNFAPAPEITVEGEGLPTLRLSTESEAEQLRMTAVNTGFSEGARVIQAIAAPGGPGPIHLAPGKHLCFDGRITLGGTA